MIDTAGEPHKTHRVAMVLFLPGVCCSDAFETWKLLVNDIVVVSDGHQTLFFSAVR